MKKKSGSMVIDFLGRMINVRSWFDWDRLKSFTVALKNAIKGLVVVQKSAPAESFDTVVAQMNLTEADLIAKQKALYRLALVMVTVALMIFIYAGYHLFWGSIKAFIVSLVLMMIALTLAFRYHFWSFQIKQRKLGCSFSEWYRKGLLGDKE